MLLARNLYNERYAVAYKDGTKLSNAQVDAIKKGGYAGAYVLDAIADEVVADLFLPDESYLYAAQFVERYTERARHEESYDLTVAPEEQEAVVWPVVEALRSKPSLIMDVIDTKPYAGYDYYHAAMVMTLSLALGMRLDFDDQQLFEIGVAALLHDIGNAFLPITLFNRPGRLTDDEFDMMKEHVQKGYDYLVNNCALPANASLGAMQHHENYDGTGYPNGLRRKKISVYARVITIADVYDALVSKRSFRAALYPSQALDMVQQQSDRKFDPDIVEELAQIIAPYPSGTTIQLKTGEKGLVMHNHPENLPRPLVLLYDNLPRGATRSLVDLRTDPTHQKTRITKIID
jgi:HD-GYP domain-containing protein (c-di-GMP phosphodiesterase class II)